MSSSMRFTSRDLECLPEVDGTRYEIIDGDLYVSKQLHWHHQRVCGWVFIELELWSRRTGAGQPGCAPGLIFAPDDDVVPDLVWTSSARLAASLDAAGHLRSAPELVVEVLSVGAENERRDRELKLKLYSRQGVREYWIVDWRERTVQIYRRVEAALPLVGTLLDDDVLNSPLLPDFACPVSSFWTGLA